MVRKLAVAVLLLFGAGSVWSQSWMDKLKSASDLLDSAASPSENLGLSQMEDLGRSQRDRGERGSYPFPLYLCLRVTGAYQTRSQKARAPVGPTRTRLRAQSSTYSVTVFGSRSRPTLPTRQPTQPGAPVGFAMSATNLPSSHTESCPLASTAFR